MKKGSTILILILMFFSQIGHQAFYLIQQLIIREEQKELVFRMLPETSLEQIKDCEQIDWEEDGKEFHLNGSMYDVVKTKIINGQKIYFAVNDQKESEVLKKFANIIREQDNSQKQNKVLKIKFQQPVFIFNRLSYSEEYEEASDEYLLRNENFNSTLAEDIPIPPPKC